MKGINATGKENLLYELWYKTCRKTLFLHVGKVVISLHLIWQAVLIDKYVSNISWMISALYDVWKIPKNEDVAKCDNKQILYYRVWYIMNVFDGHHDYYAFVISIG